MKAVSLLKTELIRLLYLVVKLCHNLEKESFVKNIRHKFNDISMNTNKLLIL